MPKVTFKRPDGSMGTAEISDILAAHLNDTPYSASARGRLIQQALDARGPLKRGRPKARPIRSDDFQQPSPPRSF